MSKDEMTRRLIAIWPTDFKVAYNTDGLCERVGCGQPPKARRPFSFVEDGERKSRPVAFCATCQTELWNTYAIARGDE